MKTRRIALLFIGGGAGLLAFFARALLSPDGALPPLAAAWSGLRTLALSGFWGNLLGWAIVLALSALPLLPLTLPRVRRAPRGEDALLPLAACVLFYALYTAVNPASAAGTDFRPFSALCTLASLLVSWLLLRLLRGLEGRTLTELAALLRLLLEVCALLVVFGAVYGGLTQLQTQSAAVTAGNTGAPELARSTVLIQGGLGLLALIPDVLGAWVLLWAAELASVLAADPFGEEASRLCGDTARRCRLVLQLSVLLAAAGNLLQLALLPALADARFSLDLPLLTLLCAAALYVLCRCIQRGKELQDDNRSII